MTSVFATGGFSVFAGWGTTLLLDALSQLAALVFSLRRLTSLAGPIVIRVRRSSDNAEADIGWAGDYLDVAALLAFVGSGDGFIVRWYEQMSGGTLYWQQTTAGLQPRIVNAGVLDADSGRAGAFSTSSGCRMTLAGASYSPAAPSSLLAVHKAGSTNGNFGVVSSELDNGTSNGIRQIRNGRAFYGTAISATPSASVVGTKYLRHANFPAVGTGIAPTLRVNGAAVGGAATSGDVAEPLGAGFNLFARASGLSGDSGGLMFEALAFNDALSDANRLLIQASVGDFYGITMA